MTDHERAVMQQALEAIEDLRGYRADIDEAITALRTALVQQAEPVSKQKRKDGKYKVLYRCQDCGHDQWITEIVAHGSTYIGGSANWCDACDDGLPVRVAMYETDVQLVGELPEFDLLYVQNSQGTRFAVDQDTELQTELLPGVTYRAQVNAEGYALKISRLHDITDSNKDN